MWLPRVFWPKNIKVWKIATIFAAHFALKNTLMSSLEVFEILKHSWHACWIGQTYNILVFSADLLALLLRRRKTSTNLHPLMTPQRILQKSPKYLRLNCQLLHLALVRQGKMSGLLLDFQTMLWDYFVVVIMTLIIYIVLIHINCSLGHMACSVNTNGGNHKT